ncbi:hypothetical protein Dimus_022586 [Dionaea muscipula]
MHTAACKEFYANLTMIHYKKHKVARLKVRGVEIEFDSTKLASILGVPGNTGICEYIKDVWEESKYIKPLETTRRFANDEMITEARRVKSTEMKPCQRFLHFVVMKNLVPRLGKRDTISYMDLTYMDHMLKRENGVWSLGSGKNIRRDDEEVAPVENEEVNEEAEAQQDFNWEAMIDEAALQGESGSNDKFYDAEVEVEEPPAEAPTVPVFPASLGDSTNVQKEPAIEGVDPSAPTGSIPDSIFSSLQEDFERARANRIQEDLERAQAKNAKLLALLQQSQSQHKP